MNAMASPPRKPRSLTLAVVDKLTADIRSGRWQTGAKLPTEALIMKDLSVSRTVVREAISRLQAAGLVQTRHGVGSFVLPQDAGAAFRVHPEQLGTLREIVTLLEFRISVETEAAALAALRRTEDNLSQMQAALKRFNEALEGGHDAVASDLQFHHEIARSSHNPHFFDLLSSLGQGMIPRARLDPAAQTQPERLAYLRRVNQEHESIFNAIRAQDPEAARAAMRTHLSNSRDRLRHVEALRH